jgi:hypothetical protein
MKYALFVLTLVLVSPVFAISFSTATSYPQLGVRDMKVTVDGQCKIGTVAGPWSNSACAKVYGPTAPTVGSSPVLSSSTSKFGTAYATLKTSSSSTTPLSDSALLQTQESSTTTTTSPTLLSREAFY